jgi:hypothetical protein
MGAGMLTPDELAALAQLPGLEAEQANLQRQLEAARALRGTPAQRHTSGAGALFGGLGTVFGDVAAGNQRRDLEGKMGDLLKRRMAPDAAMARAKGLQLQQGLEKGGLDVEATRQRMAADRAEAERMGAPIAPELGGLLHGLTGQNLGTLTNRDLGAGSQLAQAVASRRDAQAERGLRRDERKSATEAAAKKQALETEEGLRKEFTGNKLTKDTLEVAVAYQKVQQAAADPSGASDMALIFGLMKILDPGSTVREGEYATAQNTGSIPDRVVGAYNRALTGKKLDDDVRKDFVNAAGKAYAGQVEQFRKLEGTYQGLAKGSGVDPARVAIPLGVGAPTGGAGAPADGMVDVVSPTGQRGRIPAANLEKALAKGYQRAGP